MLYFAVVYFIIVYFALFNSSCYLLYYSMYCFVLFNSTLVCCTLFYSVVLLSATHYSIIFFSVLFYLIPLYLILLCCALFYYVLYFMLYIILYCCVLFYSNVPSFDFYSFGLISILMSSILQCFIHFCCASVLFLFDTSTFHSVYITLNSILFFWASFHFMMFCFAVLYSIL